MEHLRSITTFQMMEPPTLEQITKPEPLKDFYAKHAAKHPCIGREFRSICADGIECADFKAHKGW